MLPSPEKLRCIAKMNAATEFREVPYARSASEFHEFYEHVRGRKFDAMPNYAHLRGLFQRCMVAEGWNYDGAFD